MKINIWNADKTVTSPYLLLQSDHYRVKLEVSGFSFYLRKLLIIASKVLVE